MLTPQHKTSQGKPAAIAQNTPRKTSRRVFFIHADYPRCQWRQTHTQYYIQIYIYIYIYIYSVFGAIGNEDNINVWNKTSVAGFRWGVLCCGLSICPPYKSTMILIHRYVYIESMHWHIIYDYHFNKFCFLLSPLYFHFQYRRSPPYIYLYIYGAIWRGWRGGGGVRRCSCTSSCQWFSILTGLNTHQDESIPYVDYIQEGDPEHVVYQPVIGAPTVKKMIWI